MGARLNTSAPDGDDDGDYRPLAEINVTPFVDVMLVLLIVFMVAAPLMVTGVPVELPTSAATPLKEPRKPMIVTMAADGGLYIRDEQVDQSTFVSRLAQLRTLEGDTVVYVRADRRSPYGDVMAILARVGESGFQRVSLLSQPTPSQDSEVRRQ
jgi:biopolymer transport protein TolR